MLMSENFKYFEFYQVIFLFMPLWEKVWKKKKFGSKHQKDTYAAGTPVHISNVIQYWFSGNYN